MAELQPVDTNRLNELISEQKNRGEDVHQFWFVGTDGQPYWSQGPLHVSLMTGLVLRPRPDVPEYRIGDFEKSNEHAEITIVRVEEVAQRPNPMDDPRMWSTTQIPEDVLAEYGYSRDSRN